MQQAALQLAEGQPEGPGDTWLSFSIWQLGASVLLSPGLAPFWPAPTTTAAGELHMYCLAALGALRCLLFGGEATAAGGSSRQGVAGEHAAAAAAAGGADLRHRLLNTPLAVVWELESMLRQLLDSSSSSSSAAPSPDNAAAWALRLAVSICDGLTSSLLHGPVEQRPSAAALQLSFQSLSEAAMRHAATAVAMEAAASSALARSDEDSRSPADGAADLGANSLGLLLEVTVLQPPAGLDGAAALYGLAGTACRGIEALVRATAGGWQHQLEGSAGRRLRTHCYEDALCGCEGPELSDAAQALHMLLHAASHSEGRMTEKGPAAQQAQQAAMASLLYCLRSAAKLVLVAAAAAGAATAEAAAAARAAAAVQAAPLAADAAAPNAGAGHSAVREGGPEGTDTDSGDAAGGNYKVVEAALGHATMLLASLAAAVCQCSSRGGAANETQRLLLAATAMAGLEAASQAATAGQELARHLSDTACSGEEGDRAGTGAEPAPSVAAAATAWLLAMSPGLPIAGDLTASLVSGLPRTLKAARKCPGLLAVLVSGLGAAASSNSRMCLELHKGRVLSVLCEHMEHRAAAGAAADAVSAPDKLSPWREAALTAAVLRLLLGASGTGAPARLFMRAAINGLLPPEPGRTELLALWAHQPAQLLSGAARSAFAELGAGSWQQLRLKVAERSEEQAAAKAAMEQASASSEWGQLQPEAGVHDSQEEQMAVERALAPLRCANLACRQVDALAKPACLTSAAAAAACCTTAAPHAAPPTGCATATAAGCLPRSSRRCRSGSEQCMRLSQL
ncbi:hypothetical protein ABPG75_002762 [Micractinium tetrahymenae]